VHVIILEGLQSAMFARKVRRKDGNDDGDEI
jgi:hypothetical protein